MKTRALIAALALLPLAVVRAQLPVSGRPVPELSYLDTVMTGFMEEPSRTISAGVLGVSRGGRVIFLRAYGRLTPTVDLPETALMRQASLVKPITAAAIQQLSQAGGFGPANLQRRVFNLSGNGGILAISPPSAPDANAPNITLGHLLNHTGGWDRNQSNPGDIPINRVRTAGIAMNEPDALPTRTQLVDWAMQFPLNFAPGAASYTPPSPAGAPAVVPGPGPTYSNFGYLLLGEVLGATAPGGYLGYLGTNILSAQNWIPSTEWGPASTLTPHNIREPGYVSAEGPFSSVFDYTPPIDTLPAAYGGNYHIETMLAHGGLFASAQAMLRFGNLYSVGYITQGAGATQSNTIGQPVPATGFLPDSAFVAPGRSDFLHTGALPGTSTVIRQLGYGAGAADDVVIFIAFNERDETAPNPADWALQVSTTVRDYLDIVNAANTWPSATCDGFWVTLGAENATAGFGGYHSNYQGFQTALNRTTDGSQLRLRPGTQNWTGTITKRVRLDAPEGPVKLGTP
jgi:CubicO group peptidase (beta-lactamase class C family)